MNFKSFLLIMGTLGMSLLSVGCSKDDSASEEVVDNSPYIKDGALIRASYKVSANKRVYFSQGNLQFNATLGTHATADGTASGTWRFSDCQFDREGYANANASEDFSGWIDLFGWGTSGWSGGVKAYQPWATSSTISDYYIDGNKSNSMTGIYSKADWGVYNAISNGGNEPGLWRTLTYDESKYLWQNNKWTLGYVMNNFVFLLIPEDFKAPSGITVNIITSGSTEWEKNKYASEEFRKLEKLGVVAFSCGMGVRLGADVSSVDVESNFWTSTAVGVEAWCLCPGEYEGVYGVGNFAVKRNYANSVRLVQDVQ